MCTAKSRAVAGESAECIPDAGDVRDFRAGESGGAAIWVVSVKCLSLRTKKPSALNAIDLIVCLFLILAVWSGWRRGFIVQMCSLAAIVTGIWLASRFGLPLGRCLRLDDEIAAAGGFVVVFVLTILAVAIAGRLLRKLFRFAGFGVADIVLGIIVSMVKYLLVLSVLFSAFDALNVDYSLVGPRTLEQSKSYRPVMRLSASVLPFLEWVGDRVPEHAEADDETHDDE